MRAMRINRANGQVRVFARRLQQGRVILRLGKATAHVEMGNLTALLSKIRPAVEDENTVKENRNSDNSEFVDKVTLLNVKRTMKSIQQRSTILNDMVENGEIILVGGIHELSSGEVTFYSND